MLCASPEISALIPVDWGGWGGEKTGERMAKGLKDTSGAGSGGQYKMYKSITFISRSKKMKQKMLSCV
jgi:hypothetical protein